MVVGPREALGVGTVTLRDMNWLGDGPLEDIGPEGLPVLARVRSTRPPTPAVLRPLGGGGAEVELLQGETGVAPGQACALYDEATRRPRARRRDHSRGDRRSGSGGTTIERGGGVSVQYDLEGQKQAYEGWAPYYDKVYVKFLADGQKKVAAAAAACGPDILEIGVGTGLVLRYYPADTRVVGVDLSVHMLARRARRSLRKG